tara:strand:+ start:172 stop:435 length:264 start_codon:yes stop_codon:yes gene_type:complete
MPEKTLYKPFKSKNKGKKYSVYVKGKTGKPRLIHFGAAGMDDWKSGKATAAQRKSYRARASGIKNKEGKLTYKDKNTSNYWSYHYLW